MKRVKTHPIARARIVRQDPSPSQADEELSKNGEGDKEKASGGTD